MPYHNRSLLSFFFILIFLLFYTLQLIQRWMLSGIHPDDILHIHHGSRHNRRTHPGSHRILLCILRSHHRS
uniref:Uncharacterized protein n=1 Tax=Anopheles coluzzii TaxID=1518534 RepID=A0A8W7PJ64_ANOCL